MGRAASPRPAEIPIPAYLQALRSRLKQTEPAAWKWFSSRVQENHHADSIRFDLLKKAHRIDRSSQPDVYQAAESIAQALDLDVPVTLHQAHDPHGLNASLTPTLAEAHVVLHGPISAQLTPTERSALLAHELAHLQFWKRCQGEFLATEQLLNALVNVPQVHPAYLESARLFRLFSEIYCDRVAAHLSDDPPSVISMLAKTSAGEPHVDVRAFLQQVDQHFLPAKQLHDGQAPPQAYLRARALQLWTHQPGSADAEIERFVLGSPRLDRLGILGQVKLQRHTRQLLCFYFQTVSLRSVRMTVIARSFFDDLDFDAAFDVLELVDVIESSDTTISDYFCFVLLDLAMADAELQEAPLARALIVAQKLKIKDRLMELACRELRLRKRQVRLIDDQKADLLDSVGKG